MMRNGILQWFRQRATRTRLNQRRKIQIEGLESRRLLAADLSHVIGDVDLNGVFDSSDIVSVFQSGKFETNDNATSEQGDWNGDGVFNSTDVVFAFQGGGYGMTQPLAAIAENDADEVNEDSDGDGNNDDEIDNDSRRGHRQRADRPHADRHRAANSVERTIEHLNAGIASGDLPGDLTAEQANQIIADLNDAVAAEDRTAVKALLNQVRGERQQDRIQGRIDSLTERIASGELPDEMTPADAQALIDGLTQALANDDLDAARELLKQARETSEHGKHGMRQRRPGEQDFTAAHIQQRIDRLQAAVDTGKLPHNQTLESANELLAAYSAALETGELGPVMELRRELQLENIIVKIQAAIDAGELPGDLTAEALQAIVATAQNALVNGDQDGAREALQQIRSERTDHHRAGGRGRLKR